ncbi:uncharacterized protein LOC117282131 [Cryptotermes secundus]|uniref:uncharacterized protein LOC117282131 n=1 Tax=Cryptotermes secundus TaxID=105785 RepID=UPI001454D3E0|nr:uncharacterized protein LOC117282131 [Cryptotermes secundus]
MALCAESFMYMRLRVIFFVYVRVRETDNKWFNQVGSNDSSAASPVSAIKVIQHRTTAYGATLAKKRRTLTARSYVYVPQFISHLAHDAMQFSSGFFDIFQFTAYRKRR